MLPIACDLNSQALDHNIDRLAREQISIQEKLNCIDAYLLVVSWRFRRFTQGHNVVHQKLLQSAMRQWTASWCILVAQQALNLHQKWLAPVYQQWPFHQQCAAGHCWWWILSVLDNFNFLLREFYQSPLKNLEPILDFSLIEHIHYGPLSNQHRRINTLSI